MRSPQWSPTPLRFVLPLLLLTLPSCAILTRTAAPSVDVAPGTNANMSYCLVDRAISYDRLADTEQTVTEVKAHNAVYDGLCAPAPAK